MNKLQQIVQIISNMGWRYFFFRAWFEFKRRSGFLKSKFPMAPAFYEGIALDEWKKKQQPFFFPPSQERENPNFFFKGTEGVNKEKLRQEAVAIRNGNICFFNSKEYFLGKDYNWVTNPDSGFVYDIKKHWTEINDYSKEAGDIKFVWEKSRFTFLYTLIRDEQFNKTKQAEFIFSEIESWIAHNPINCGPNYKCSQEISLRVMNWIFALYYYTNDEALTQARWEKIINAIYWQMHHVYCNINFSRIAVRNNHAITETLALFIAGTLFPWMKDASTWKRQGKKWFEEEIIYQIYKDGSYLQFSMNYQRVVVQLLTWAFRIAELNKDKFSSLVYDRAFQAINFLFQCQEPSNGHLPNYGANDGALFFPLNSCEYRDFRPQLNALHKVICGKPLYETEGVWSEDAYWFGPHSYSKSARLYLPIQKQYGVISFPTGGYYLIREKRTFTFIRCGNHKDRPSQADNLHIDIWVDGINILPDAGSYKYNTDSETLTYFMGTASHNTVMLANYDQMLKGARFIWYDWTQAISARLEEKESEFIFEGMISSFSYLNKNSKHRRKVIKYKEKLHWEIEDEVVDKADQVPMKQLWHIHPEVKDDQVGFYFQNENEVVKTEKKAWFSTKYGEKISSTMIEIKTIGNTIRTQLKLN